MSTRVLITACMAALAVPCFASTMIDHAYNPTPSDLDGLDHTKIYFWGLNPGLDPGHDVVAASLTFNQIHNWDNNSNHLYNHLLNWCPLGVTKMTDNQGGGDFFANLYPGSHTHLVTYDDLTTTPVTLTYNFDAAEVAALNDYLADGRIGIGLDPDCHYYNGGITLTLTTPEPASLGMLALGALGLVIRRR